MIVYDISTNKNRQELNGDSHNISDIGYGGVFDFYNNADLIYDNMNGVDLDV